MKEILCSSGAFIGKANGDDYRLLKTYAPKLDCDGFELLISRTWYPEMDKMIEGEFKRRNRFDYSNRNSSDY